MWSSCTTSSLSLGIQKPIAGIRGLSWLGAAICGEAGILQHKVQTQSCDMQRSCQFTSLSTNQSCDAHRRRQTTPLSTDSSCGVLQSCQITSQSKEPKSKCAEKRKNKCITEYRLQVVMFRTAKLSNYFTEYWHKVVMCSEADKFQHWVQGLSKISGIIACLVLFWSQGSNYSAKITRCIVTHSFATISQTSISQKGMPVVV